MDINQRFDSLGEIINRQLGGSALCSNSSPKPAPQPPQRTPINPEIMELLAELVLRFPKGEKGDGERQRLRLLAEDLSETMTPAALTAAIKEGRKTWTTMPVLALILEAAKPYREEQRDKARDMALQREQAERHRLQLAAPAQFDSAPILAEMRAKIVAGTAALIGAASTDPDEPITWRLMREAGRNISPQMEALRDGRYEPPPQRMVHVKGYERRERGA